MGDENKKMAVIDQPGNMPVQSDLLSLAIKQGAGVDQLEKLMELQERHEANEARKAYVVAMTAFKANPPKINKDAHVNYKSQKTGQVTDYKHSTLGNVVEKISTELSKHGLSAAWSTSQEKGIAVTCTITHILGHSEKTTLAAEADTSGGKNAIQGIGSTVTYLERYTLLSLTGLATEEMDDDGRGTEAEYIDDEQMATINEWIESIGGDCLKNFKKYMEVDDLSKIPASHYKRAITALKNTQKKKEKGDKK